jgi:ubiquinone/menaquinone biosynthesis C-methylase UbiE
VLEHLNQADLGFQEAVRVVKPKGVIVVTVPFEAGFRYDSTHVRYFSKKDLALLALHSGVDLEKLYSYPFAGELLGKILYFYEIRAVYRKH